MSTNTRSALRASLKQEDAALDERLPDAASTAGNTEPTAPGVTAPSATEGMPAIPALNDVTGAPAALSAPAPVHAAAPAATPTPKRKPRPSTAAAKPAPTRAKGVPPKTPARSKDAKLPASSTPTAPAAGPARATTAAATSAKLTPPARSKPEKRSRESFALVASDLHRLDSLRATLKAAGRRTRKSELVRAGLVALAALDTAATIAHLDALPPRARSARKDGRKKPAAKGKPSARKR